MNIRLTDDYPQECEISEKGDVSLMIGVVLPFFLGGVLLSSWGWSSKAALETWRRWLLKRCRSSAGKIQDGLEAGGGGLRKRVYDDPLGINMLLDHRRLLGLPPLGDEGEGEEFLGESHAYPPSFTDGESMMSGGTWGMVGVEDSRRGSFESNVEGGGGGGVGGGKNVRRRDWFERMTSRHNGRRWGGGGRRGVGGSSTSLASSTGSQILHAVTALIDKRLGLGRWGWGGGGERGNGGGREERGDGVVDVLMQEGGLQGLGDGGGGRRVTLIVREMGVQTSLEDLTLKGVGDEKKVEKEDMATQVGQVDLREIGTQTKKSATKKMGRGRGREEEEDGIGGQGGGGGMDLDAVEKLLSPN